MGEVIVDLYAGPGGWDEGARLAGLTGRIIGWEWDPAACATAEAAGHERRREDVSATNPAAVAAELGPVVGGLASPPFVRPVGQPKPLAVLKGWGTKKNPGRLTVAILKTA